MDINTKAGILFEQNIKIKTCGDEIFTYGFINGEDADNYTVLGLDGPKHGRPYWKFWIVTKTNGVFGTKEDANLSENEMDYLKELYCHAKIMRWI